MSDARPTFSGNLQQDTQATVGSQGTRGERSGYRRRGGRGGRGGGGERMMVPPAEFTSYYGRPVLKPSPWEADIPAYLFLGGLAAGSSLLGAGADVTGRASLRRPARITALAAITASFVALVHDLGKPGRFVNMLRVAKPTSPMSVGTWILSGYAPLAGVAVAGELHGLIARLLPRRVGWVADVLRVAARPTGIGAAVVGPAVASYTAVLIADTATPTWHEAYRQLPFVFVGSAAAASGGMGLITASVADSRPARALAVGGAVLDLGAAQVMERSLRRHPGDLSEPLHTGTPGTLMRAAKTLTATGAVGALLGRRSRVASALSGACLVAGSVCTRFGIFEAGQESAKDPKYTIVPQRARVDARGGPTRAE